MRLKYLLVPISLAALAGLGSPSYATPVYEYNYQGYAYDTFPISSQYSSSNHITATLDLSEPLLANETYVWGAGGIGAATASDTLLSFQESDGSVSYDQGGTNFYLTTNGGGGVASWFIGACGSCGTSAINVDTQYGITISPYVSAGLDGSTAGSGVTILAYNYGEPGVWSEVTISAAPEPSSWLLMIAGVGVVGALLRRRGRTVAPARPVAAGV